MSCSAVFMGSFMVEPPAQIGRLMTLIRPDQMFYLSRLAIQ